MKLMKETHTSTMQELLQLDMQSLKDAAQRLWRDMCAVRLKTGSQR